MQNKQIITRIAPSPTGLLHVGTARAALFNYLFAKKHDGKFVVRIEDTDKERSKKEFEENILEGLDFLGLKYDELIRQSENLETHKKYILKLIEEDKAYVSEEESKKDPSKKVQVVRLRNKGKEITFNDVVRGDITFDTTELGDFVIAKNIDEPLYHLAVVVDDHEVSISHVIRGEDHISNTPRQILIQEALGFDRPIYAHLPLILGVDRSKLSKRHGAISISDYSKDFLPESLINYLALLGWNPGTDKEFFSMDELIEEFSLEKIQKGGAIFDIEKLKSINHNYFQKMDIAEFSDRISEFLPVEITENKILLTKICTVLKERVKTFSEVSEMVENGEFNFYFKKPKYEKESLTWKDSSIEETKVNLQKILELLENVGEDKFNEESIKTAIWDYAEEKGKGPVLWPLRYSLTGADKSPDPFTVASALGKKEVISRIEEAINKI